MSFYPLPKTLTPPPQKTSAVFSVASVVRPLDYILHMTVEMKRLSLLFAVCMLFSCAGDLPTKYDSSPYNGNNGTNSDYSSSGWSDSWSGSSGSQDYGNGTSSSTEAGYSGNTFGCQSDNDCFGQRCCATPWGVKLCRSDCN